MLNQLSKHKLVMTVLLTSVCFIVYNGFLYARLLPFDSSLWLKSKACKPISDSSLRGKMLSDLRSNILPGLSKDEIENLLGNSLDAKYLNNEKRDLLYCLGNKGIFNLYSTRWLAVDFNSAGIYEKSRVLTAD